MPKLSDIRRIVVEDFPEEFQESAGIIANSYNEFADELYQIVNGQLDYDNLSRSKVSFDVIVNSSGVPTTGVTISTNLTSVSGVTILKVDNISNSSTRLTQAPFLQFTATGNGMVRVDYILGLIASNKYRLTLEFQ